MPAPLRRAETGPVGRAVPVRAAAGEFEDPRDQWAERKRLAGLSPPKACLPKTRLSVVLPDLPDVGVWRLDTGSVQAAGHITSKLAIMEAAASRRCTCAAACGSTTRSASRKDRPPGTRWCR